MIFENVKTLEENYERACNLLNEKNKEIGNLNLKLKHYKKCCEMIIPEKLYVCKKRRNTTIRFRDGSCMIVKRKAGEKDCIETAIAYCILKQLLTASDIKKLIKEREEH